MVFVEKSLIFLIYFYLKDLAEKVFLFQKCKHLTQSMLKRAFKKIFKKYIFSLFFRVKNFALEVEKFPYPETKVSGR